MHRVLINGIRGGVARLAVYPLAEWIEGRDIRSRQRALAAEMARPFSVRKGLAWAAVIDTVRFAAAEVPYYRDLFARIRFDPEKLARDNRYFADIPFLTKEIIRDEGERLLRQDHAGRRKHVSKTGGSTGPSAQIVYDQEAADWSSAVTRHARHSIGCPHGRSELHFASKFPDVFPLRDRLRERGKCLAMNRHNLFFASFDADELEAIWQRLEALRPTLVHGHPSTLYSLALHVRDRHGGGKAFAIFESSGEVLQRHQRTVISQALQCRIVNRYGLAEFGVVAYETDPRVRGMLVFDAVAWPEIIAAEGNDELPRHAQARAGELVLTGLRNRMMPLIRYRTGDLASLSEEPRGFVVHDIVGRVHDVIGIAGRLVPTHYVQDVLDRIGGIRLFQIELRGSTPVLRLVAEADADTSAIRAHIARWWGEAVAVEFVAASDLKLQGWRAKFRHLVPTQTGDSSALPLQ